MLGAFFKLRRLRGGAGRRSQAGDTIVEVLIAVAIASFVLAVAYVTANKNALMNQDTQERSQALQLAATQIEFLHSNNGISGGTCFNAAGGVASNGACVVKADGTAASSSDQPAYTIAISGSTTYAVSVTWDSVAGSTRSSIVLYYQQP